MSENPSNHTQRRPNFRLYKAVRKVLNYLLNHGFAFRILSAHSTSDSHPPFCPNMPICLLTKVAIRLAHILLVLH